MTWHICLDPCLTELLRQWNILLHFHFVPELLFRDFWISTEEVYKSIYMYVCMYMYKRAKLLSNWMENASVFSNYIQNIQYSFCILLLLPKIVSLGSLLTFPLIPIFFPSLFPSLTPGRQMLTMSHHVLCFLISFRLTLHPAPTFPQQFKINVVYVTQDFE